MSLNCCDYERRTKRSKIVIPCMVYFGNYNIGY